MALSFLGLICIALFDSVKELLPLFFQFRLCLFLIYLTVFLPPKVLSGIELNVSCMCLWLFLLFARDNHQLSQQRSGNSFWAAAAEEVKKKKNVFACVLCKRSFKKFHFSASVITEENYFILKADFWSLENFFHFNFFSAIICAI